MDEAEAFAVELRRVGEELRAADAAARGLSDAVGDGLTRAFDEALFGGARLSDAVRGAALELSRAALKAAATPAGEAIGRGAGGVVSGALAALTGAAAGGATATPAPAAPLAAAGMSVTMNVTTPDAAGFRRSQSQVAAALARAVKRGARGL
jgi:hypothetical protein